MKKNIQLIDLKQLINSHYPRSHFYAVSGLIVILLLSSIFAPSQKIAAKRTQIPLIINIEPQTEYANTITLNNSINISSNSREHITQKIIPDSTQWKKIIIREGDTLADIFKKQGISAQTLFQLTKSDRSLKALSRIFPGDVLAFRISQDKRSIQDQNLLEFRYSPSAFKAISYKLNGKTYDATQIERSPDVLPTYKAARIVSSLYSAGKTAGITGDIILHLTNIFGGVIDFALDIRTGDSFHVVYEELYLDGEKIGHGKILAARFINQGQSFQAVLYKDTNGNTGYYTPNGISMRKAFLKAPVDFTRISSNFSLKRLHPILKTYRPHRGTDYAAPKGTKVLAAGDGKIIASSYNKPSGKYITIQHGQAYQTKYLHLSKRWMKKGQRVKQGQVIGLVGSTGWATASHLHYEFLVNGVHRNPRTILKKLPKAKAIAKKEKANFVQQVSPRLVQLKTFTEAAQLALSYPPKHG